MSSPASTEPNVASSAANQGQHAAPSTMPDGYAGNADDSILAGLLDGLFKGLTDPATGAPFTFFLDSKATSRLLGLLGIPIEAQTLAHQRSRGVGLRWRYRGQVALTTLPEVARFVREEALVDVSPLKPGARERAQARAARERELKRQGLPLPGKPRGRPRKTAPTPPVPPADPSSAPRRRAAP